MTGMYILPSGQYIPKLNEKDACMYENRTIKPIKIVKNKRVI
jgi:hypothetical protein